MLRPLLLATVASSALTGMTGLGGLGPLPPLPLLSGADSLTVSIEKTGHAEADGTFRLECDGTPGGTHPAAANACKRLDQLAQAGADPFAAVPADGFCTQQYGGPATAHITGTWQGRSVDARFSRANGCEIDRWENLRPVLPHVKG
ncbi:subtilase-type protease inhibitor [Streptomyces sp. SKN60]|uniref:SSI family serine proteinase inhibitor n=1 Tax=Streptomyces sp. SKN60 TaxID=2855506 RepID=UPI002246151F|nr:SSI family serine proteinase inhibitor [Streptomyces sp. SKN60]MCX2179065.1 subtilase-type protease inhibitor [Streptomyces sp. SKN60]